MDDESGEFMERAELVSVGILSTRQSKPDQLVICVHPIEYVNMSWTLRCWFN